MDKYPAYPKRGSKIPKSTLLSGKLHSRSLTIYICYKVIYTSSNLTQCYASLIASMNIQQSLLSHQLTGIAINRKNNLVGISTDSNIQITIFSIAIYSNIALRAACYNITDTSCHINRQGNDTGSRSTIGISSNNIDVG